MTDTISKEHRSWNMSRVRSKNTKPEIVVRKLLHALGYRFRLHGKVSKKLYKQGILPGKPDIVLAKYRTVIFVHGCFWHRHENCSRATTPKSRTEFWVNKFTKNVKRDTQIMKSLRDLNWNVITIWECEILAFLKEVKSIPAADTALAQQILSSIHNQDNDVSENDSSLPLAAEEATDYGL